MEWWCLCCALSHSCKGISALLRFLNAFAHDDFSAETENFSYKWFGQEFRLRVTPSLEESKCKVAVVLVPEDNGCLKNVCSDGDNNLVVIVAREVQQKYELACCSVLEESYGPPFSEAPVS